MPTVDIQHVCCFLFTGNGSDVVCNSLSDVVNAGFTSGRVYDFCQMFFTDNRNNTLILRPCSDDFSACVDRDDSFGFICVDSNQLSEVKALAEKVEGMPKLLVLNLVDSPQEIKTQIGQLENTVVSTIFIQLLSSGLEQLLATEIPEAFEI
jgi:hypothetical protein